MALLRGANLVGSGIEETHLPGADLTGANTGDGQEKLAARLELAKSLADSLRSVLIASIGLYAYTSVSIISTTDALLLTNRTTMALPVVDAQVSVHDFFLFAGILVVALSSYTLSAVSHFARIVARLPANLPMGPPLREQVDPWVLSCLGIPPGRNLPLLGDVELGMKARLFEIAGAKLPALATTWMGPAVLAVLVTRFFAAWRADQGAQRIIAIYVFLVALFFAAMLTTYAIRSYAALVDGRRRRVRTWAYFVAGFGVVAFAVALRWATDYYYRYGAPDENLANANLAFARLNDWNFSGSNLAEATLARASLQRARFPEAILDRSDLRRARIDQALFVSASMVKANLGMTTGERTNFGEANLKGCDLRHARIPHAILQRADLSSSRLDFVSAPGMVAGRVNLSGASLEDANLSFSFLNGALLTEATLFRTNFTSSDLSSAKLERASLFDAVLTGANLTDANLTGAHAAKAIMIGTFLRRTVMNLDSGWRADFSSATIVDVPFRTQFGGLGVNLGEAKFANAALTRVSFEGANLYRADFSGARFKDVTLTGANLQDAIFAPAEIEGTLDLRGTHVDPGRLTAEQKTHIIFEDEKRAK